MTDLAEFLLARIADDEAVARAAGSGPWSWEQRYGDMCNDPECPFGSLMQTKVDGQLYRLMDVHGFDVTEGWQGAGHIARFDPARVLADCEAKRRIVADLTEAVRVEGGNTYPAEQHGLIRLFWQEREHYLRLLALPYADHPDYRVEWRP